MEVTSINDFRDQGYTAEAIANYMTLLGWSVPEGMDERFSLTQASDVFSFDRVNKAGARFDWDKLNWLNAQVLHGMSAEQLEAALRPLWEAESWELPSEKQWISDLCALIGPSLTLIQDGVDQARPFFVEPPLEADGLKQLEQEGAKAALKALVDLLESSAWDGADAADAQALLASAAKTAGVKKGVLMKSLARCAARQTPGSRSDHHLVSTGPTRMRPESTRALSGLNQRSRQPLPPPAPKHGPVAVPSDPGDQQSSKSSGRPGPEDDRPR